MPYRSSECVFFHGTENREYLKILYILSEYLPDSGGRNRRTGVAKLKIKEMGSQYLFICLYAWLEKYFSWGDFKKHENP